MSKSVKHSSKSAVGLPKVLSIHQHQGSDGHICETFVKNKGAMHAGRGVVIATRGAMLATRGAMHGVGCPKV